MSARCVLIDIATLRTLPDRELASGLSEVVKYGLIRDAPLFQWLEANMDRLLDRDPEVRCPSCVQPRPCSTTRLSCTGSNCAAHLSGDVYSSCGRTSSTLWFDQPQTGATCTYSNISVSHAAHRRRP